MSAEQTPTLSIVLPLYEKLIVMLANLAKAKPQLAHAIDAAIEKLRDYLAETRTSKGYIMAMGMYATVRL